MQSKDRETERERERNRGLILSVGLVLGVIAVSILCSLYSGNTAEITKSTTGLTASSPGKLKDVILAKVSEREKVPINNLEVINMVTLKPENVYRAKVLDKKACKIYGLDLDSDYKVMDKADIGNILKNKRKSQFVGKLSKGLVRKMAEMKKSGETHINVEMWIKPDKKLPQLPREILTDQEKDARLKEIRDFYDNQKSTNSVVKKLGSMGHQVRYRSQYAPLIFVRMPIDDVTKVEADTNIDTIYATETAKPQLDTSAYTIGANTAWDDPNYNRCPDEWLGYIPIVAIIEKNGIAKPYIQEQEPYTAIQGPISYRCPEEANPNCVCPEDDPDCVEHNNSASDDHATKVMGIIAADGIRPGYGSIPPCTVRGIAYNVCRPLLSACFTDYYAMATEWALSHWATVLNNSWGSDPNISIDYLQQWDRYFDLIADNYHRTVVAAAGNYSDPNRVVTSPGKGWNVITVGAFNDCETPTWSGDCSDFFCGFSCYGNPYSVHGDRQKPEVVAPGEGILTTIMNWPGYAVAEPGTSLAAPHVTGAAALLISKLPSLEAWPEEVAAILMASAIHDIVSEPADPNRNPFLHDKDGVGAIDIASAKNVIDNGLNSHHILAPEDLPYDKIFSVTEGENVRAVIRWHSHAEWDPNDHDHLHHVDIHDELKADLALIACDPNGFSIMSSDSQDNNYEIVGFTAPTTGDYKIRITSYRGFESENEHVGLAICKY